MDAGREQGSVSDKRTIVAPIVRLGLTKFDWCDGSLNLFQIRFRISQRNRAVVSQSELQHRFDIRLIARGHDGEVREKPQINRVKQAMMRGTVRARQAAPVQAENDRQV